MFPRNNNDPSLIRKREKLKEKVEGLRNEGKTEEEIVEVIEEEWLFTSFDDVHDLTNYIGIPASKFNVVWV